MKILITGSNGMLGTDLCDLLSKDNTIIGIDLIGTLFPVADHSFHQMSITNSDDIKKIIDEEKPDVVIHTAAFTDVDGCENDPLKAKNLNIEGTKKIVSAISEQGIPLIFISTDFVFDGKKTKPYVEDDMPSPISVYGKTKLEAEEFIEANLLNYTIVRTSWLFGKHGKNFVDTIISKSKTGKGLKIVDDQVGSPTYTKDLAIAISKLLKNNILNGRNVFHITNSGNCSWYEFANRIISVKGIGEVNIEPIVSGQLERSAKRPNFSVLSNKRFEKATGYKMRLWKDALEDYLNNE